MKLGENRINFLNLTIIINEKKMLEFNWFHKSTFSGHYLNYLSTHKFSEERCNNGNDRVLLLSPKFHYKNMKFIVNSLLNNDYPIDFIFNTNSHLKVLFLTNKLRTKKNNVDSDSTNEERPPWFILSSIDIRKIVYYYEEH